MLDAFQKMLAWLAAMLTGATFRRGSARGYSQKLGLSSPVTILLRTATGMKTAPAVSASEEGSHSGRFWSGPVIHQTPLARMQYEL
jgi:hypothetical protein